MRKGVYTKTSTFFEAHIGVFILTRIEFDSTGFLYCVVHMILSKLKGGEMWVASYDLLTNDCAM